MIPPKQTHTILLAEDDNLVRTVAVATLVNAGYHVVGVENGEELFLALPQVKPDLVLSDIRMPRCDGFELLQRMRSMPAYQTLPFIFMTAKADSADQRMGMSLGADDYVIKPYLPEDLLKTIELRLERVAIINARTEQRQRFLSRVLPHELRTPLTAIIGYADLLKYGGDNNETLDAAEMREYGRNIGRSGERLLQIAEDFTLWAYFEQIAHAVSGGESPSLKPTTLSSTNLLKWVKKPALEYGRLDDLSILGDTVSIMVLNEGLAAVVQHLVVNAFKFSLPGTGVHLSLKVDASDVEISVADRGRGMTDEDIANVGLMRQFGRERFEQQGMGMGLILAKTFAELSGGSLTLRRNTSGVGLFAQLKLRLAS
jgi:two-component system, sensor histidine kinase and response regulator